MAENGTSFQESFVRASYCFVYARYIAVTGDTMRTCCQTMSLPGRCEYTGKPTMPHTIMCFIEIQTIYLGYTKFYKLGPSRLCAKTPFGYPPTYVSPYSIWLLYCHRRHTPQASYYVEIPLLCS